MKLLIVSETKLILRKQAQERTEKDIDKLIKFFNDYDYFKKEKNFSYS